MTQHELDRLVADATGEDVRLIRNLGFSSLDPRDDCFDPEPDDRPPKIIDWDELQQQRGNSVHDRTSMLSTA